MVRYTAEQKQNALEKMEEIGVQKTQEELGISIQTLYKWRAENKPAAEKPVKEPAPKAKAKAKAKTTEKETSHIRALLNEDDAMLLKIKRLEEENAALIAMNMKLKKALTAFIDD